MNDTISAIATAKGEGGIAIIRLSGAESERILREIFIPAHAKRAFETNRLMYGTAVNLQGQTLDEVMAVIMRAPYTYTREDVAEIHCHGGTVCAEMILRETCLRGARPAEPGEFTRRAFLNGRIDLAEAEAVMQLIGARSEASARASVRQLNGGVSEWVNGIRKKLIDLMSLIEASDDYPEEVEEDAAVGELLEGIDAILAELNARIDEKGARMLTEGTSIVLAGRPNTGKSSLMNALTHSERAIVTETAGTTRDVLTERVSLGGIAATLSDTAGMRETLDTIEKIGVSRAKRAVENADIVLIVLDASENLTDEDRELLDSRDERSIVVFNKTDKETVLDAKLADVMISAKTGEGVDALAEMLKERLAKQIGSDALVTDRHISLAKRAREALFNAKASLEAGFPADTAAVDLKEALDRLSDITGENPTEDVIARVFERFCVGK